MLLSCKQTPGNTQNSNNNLVEHVITEDFVIEEYIVEYATIEDLANNRLLSQAMVPDIDWKAIISKYAVGTIVIVFTVVLSVVTASTTPVACVFVRAFKDSVVMKGAFSGAAIGGGIAAIKSNGRYKLYKEICD